jgi:hypothetical protein
MVGVIAQTMGLSEEDVVKTLRSRLEVAFKELERHLLLALQQWYASAAYNQL